MGAPAMKRRKLEHASSASEDDDASFGGFSEEGGEDGPTAADLGVEREDGGAEEEMIVEDGGSPRSDSDGSEAGDKPAKAKSRDKANNHNQSIKTKSTIHDGSSAYLNGTFKSSIFKLQVDELLGQIRPKHGKRERDVESALHTLKGFIDELHPKGPLTVDEAERYLLRNKIAIPFPESRPPKDARYKLAYEKPAFVNVVGSFPLKTGSRSRNVLEVDMVVQMPRSMFEEKDYLNYRYFYKRAFYLAYVASMLQADQSEYYSYKFELLHNDALKPIIAIVPKPDPEDASEHAPVSKWRINLIPCVAQDQFPMAKLKMDRNCVRNASRGEGEQLPTPFYNSSLRADMLMIAYLKQLHDAKKSCEAFVDACLLGSTWLRQRGFESSCKSSGFGNFEWTALMALGLQGGGPRGKALLSPGYSSYQLFKATLQLLAVKDFVRQPLIVGDASNASNHPNNAGPLVWDASRGHNLFYKVQQWSYKMLRYEARSTLDALGDQLHDGFEATFILRGQEPLFRFDSVVEIPSRAIRERVAPCGHDPQEHLSRLYDVLKQGLGDRVHQINIVETSPASWALGSARPRNGEKGDVTVGLIVNQDTARRTVDHGPPAENTAEAKAFRNFWGEKAELRRFKDGSIVESLVWTSAEKGESVLVQVLQYLLGHHFGLVTTEDLTIYGDDFARLIRGGSERTMFEHLMTRYNQFENDLRDLRELPLSIRQILPADAQLRYASLQTPPNGKAPSRLVPADVVVQFEGSGRWPDDLVAIQRTKIAFLLKVSEMLSESVDSVVTRIGLENEGNDVLNQAFLDVTYDVDAAFRLRIYHDREQTLHERRLKDKSVDPKSREVSATGLAKYKRDYLKAPAHTQAICRLCIRYPALSGSIRLAKRWFASHLLDNHIADEVVELLVARTFTQPWPWQTPSSVQTGFLRTLFWLSRWDWRAEPLIVDLSMSGELKQPEMKAITTDFEAWRKLDPALNRVVLFAASNVDRDGTTWTDGCPQKVVAGRMTALAKAACAEVSRGQLELEPASLFSSPLQDFDFVLHLSPAFSGGKTKPSGKAGSTFKNLELDILDNTEMIGFEPTRDLLHELQELYGTAILFFYGGSERPVIAGLWSPLTARRSWKVNLSYSTTPTSTAGEEDVQATLNKSAILAEMARIGGDLIERVEGIEH